MMWRNTCCSTAVRSLTQAVIQWPPYVTFLAIEYLPVFCGLLVYSVCRHVTIISGEAWRTAHIKTIHARRTH